MDRGTDLTATAEDAAELRAASQIQGGSSSVAEKREQELLRDDIAVSKADRLPDRTLFKSWGLEHLTESDDEDEDEDEYGSEDNSGEEDDDYDPAEVDKYVQAMSSADAEEWEKAMREELDSDDGCWDPRGDELVEIEYW